MLALSPDGSLLAFVGTNNGVNQIYLRRLEQLGALPLAGTNGGDSPFFSPDGEWLGYGVSEQQGNGNGSAILARWAMDRVSIGRVRPVGNIRTAIPGTRR
jgi:Tol biopolymer transport system component